MYVTPKAKLVVIECGFFMEYMIERYRDTYPDSISTEHRDEIIDEYLTIGLFGKTISDSFMESYLKDIDMYASASYSHKIGDVEILLELGEMIIKCLDNGGIYYDIVSFYKRLDADHIVLKVY